VVQKTKIYFTIIFHILAYSYAQNISAINKKDESTSTQVKQIYRFDRLPDNGTYKISIEDVSSNIKIYGKEGSGALITITRIIWGLKENKIKEAHKLASTSVNHIEEQNLIQIIGENIIDPKYYIETIIHLELPKNVNLNFQILGGNIDLNDIRGESTLQTLGGDIFIKNFDGHLELKTEGGIIKINDTKGVLRAHSSGGNLNIEKCEGKIYSSTIGGDIHLVNLNGELDIQSSGGSIHLSDIKGNEINCRASGGLIKGKNIFAKCFLKSFGDNIELSNIHGEIDLHVFGGTIKVNNSIGSLKCEVESGDIELKEITGTVESFTSSGDIMLELIYDSTIKNNSIHLETHSGNLIAHIPKGLPANINSVINQTSSVKELNSEIVLDIMVEQNRVIGTTIIKGGTIPINLEAHNGFIVIKEN